jgi:hypothetical protein
MHEPYGDSREKSRQRSQGGEKTSFGRSIVQRAADNLGVKDHDSPSQGKARSKIFSGRDAGFEAMTGHATSTR